MADPETALAAPDLPAVQVGALDPTAPTPQPIFGSGGGPPVWVAPDDVTEELPDGRLVQIFAKGKGYPLGEAARYGQLEAADATRALAGPSETKEGPRVGPNGGRLIVGAPPKSDAADATTTPAGAERPADVTPAKGKK